MRLPLYERQAIELRPYQKQVVQDTHQAIADGSMRPLIVAGTGSGKTIMASQLLKDFVGQGKRCLFLVHLDVLVGQTADKLESFGVEHGFIKAGWTEDRDAPVQIASVQTLPRRRWWRSHHFDVIFLDEAHRTAWTTITKQLISDYYPSSIFVGLTATPWRLSKREGMGDVFDSIVLAPLPRDLIDAGSLVKPRYYSLPQADLSSVGTIAGDFAEDDLAIACNQPELIQRLVDEYQRLSPGKRAIAFAVNVAHARAIAEVFNAAGIPAASVDGSTPIPERQRIYGKLADGELQLLSGCNVFCEGFDVPAVETCLLARPTKSKALYFQQIGRVLRPSNGKSRALLLDQAGNVRRFGFVEDLSGFDLTLGKPKGDGDAPVKECPRGVENHLKQTGCGAIVRAFATECPECGFSFVKKKEAPQQNLVELLVNERDRHHQSIWDAVLNCLHPLARTLFKDKGKLVSLTDNAAVVSVEMRSLMPLFQARIPDVERAFLATVKTRIAVSVIVEEKPSLCPHQADIDELMSICERSGYQRGWVGHKVLGIPGITQADLSYAARVLGYHHKWAIHKWRELQEAKMAIAQ